MNIKTQIKVFALLIITNYINGDIQITKNNAKSLPPKSINEYISNKYQESFQRYRKNLFERELDKLGEWNEAVSILEQYVKDKSHKSKSIPVVLNQLLNINSKLVNTIKLLYNATFYGKLASEDTRNQLKSNLESLILELNNKAIPNIEKIQTHWYESSKVKSDKSDVKIVLGNFALELTNLAGKAKTDYTIMWRKVTRA